MRAPVACQTSPQRPLRRALPLRSGKKLRSFDPSITIAGLPDAAVQESRERIQAAIKNANLAFPSRKRLIVNLAPASVRKEGPAYDLPIAVGVLVTNGQLPQEAVDDALIVGELSLDGGVRHVRGVLPVEEAWFENNNG